MIKPSGHSHSADVCLSLQIGDRCIPLDQIGDRMIVVRKPAAIPTCVGTLVMTIDGIEFRSTVRLPDGSDGLGRRIAVEIVGAAVPMDAVVASV